MTNIEVLKQNKFHDFQVQIENLRTMMRIIGKNNISLNTSEPLGVGHTYGLDKKYSLQVSLNSITFLDNRNITVMVDDKYIQSCKWFQVYIYIVEIEFELNKINTHIGDSLTVSKSLSQ